MMILTSPTLWQAVIFDPKCQFYINGRPIGVYCLIHGTLPFVNAVLVFDSCKTNICASIIIFMPPFSCDAANLVT